MLKWCNRMKVKPSEFIYWNFSRYQFVYVHFFFLSLVLNSVPKKKKRWAIKINEQKNVAIEDKPSQNLLKRLKSSRFSYCQIRYKRYHRLKPTGTIAQRKKTIVISHLSICDCSFASIRFFFSFRLECCRTIRTACFWLAGWLAVVFSKCVTGVQLYTQSKKFIRSFLNLIHCSPLCSTTVQNFWRWTIQETETFFQLFCFN